MMGSYLTLVIFNFKRLFKHWSSFVLIIITILTTIGLCIVSNYKSYKYVKTVPGIYESVYRGSEYFRPATKNHKADITLKIKNNKFGYNVIVSKNQQVNANEEKEVIEDLKQELNSKFIIQNNVQLPRIYITREYKVSENKSSPLILLGVYTLLLLIGIMTFMAVSAEKIDKMLFLISSKVSFKKVIYSKVMAIFIFVIVLCLCMLLTLVALNFTKYFSFQNLLQKLSSSSIILLLKVLSLIFVGILQTICIYGFFALLINDATQLQTGMMIPTLLELLSWISVFSINTEHFHLGNVVNQMNWIPLFNILSGVENSFIKINVHWWPICISTLILLIIFDISIYRITKLRSESRLLLE